MKFRIDFSLSYSSVIGVVERTVFRLVIAGISDIQSIRFLLSLISDNVIAKAIRVLVNNGLLFISLERGQVFLSNQVLDLLESCRKTQVNLDLPDSVKRHMIDHTVYLFSDVTDSYETKRQCQEIKKALLVELLPNTEEKYLTELGELFDFCLSEVN